MEKNDDMHEKLSSYFREGTPDNSSSAEGKPADQPIPNDVPAPPSEVSSEHGGDRPEESVETGIPQEHALKISSPVPEPAEVLFSQKSEISGDIGIPPPSLSPAPEGLPSVLSGVVERLSVLKPFRDFFSNVRQLRSSVGTFVGLDIGTQSAKLVQLAVTPKEISLMRCACQPLPHKTASSEEERHQLVLQAIRELVQRERLEAVSVATSVGGSSVGVASLTLPKMPKKDLRNALALEFKKALPFDLNSAIFEYQIVREFTEKNISKIEVLAMAAQRSVVDEHIMLLREAGLRPAKIDIIPNALGKLVSHFLTYEKEEVIALADMGARSTTICFFNAGRLEFSREVLTGGEHISQAMVRKITTDRGSVDITFDDAERLKQRWGIPNQQDVGATLDADEIITPSQISALIRPVLERLMTEVKRSLNYYRQTFHIPKINKILLTGGGSRLRNVDEYFSKNLLNMTVEHLNPLHYISGWGHDQFGEHEALDDYAPQLAVATGLALDKKGRTNFIPFTERIQQKLNLVEFALKVAVPIIIVILVGFHLVLAGQASRYWKLVVDARSQLAFIEPTMKKVREHEKLKTMITTRRTLLTKAVGRRPLWAGILKELSFITPEGVILSRLSVDEETMPMELIVEGDIYPSYTSIDLALSNFLITLDESPFFSRVILVSSTKDVYSSTPQGSFEVRCRLIY